MSAWKTAGVIDECLEDCRGVGQTEGHHQVLVMTCRGVEGRLPLVSVSVANQMVSIPKVELGEHRCPLEHLEGRGE